MKVSILSFVLVFSTLSSYSQSSQPSASEIKLKLKKLNFLGSVLYVAAHPDDENTRAIAYLSNERLAATAYLSMTRGDGGQNLIGPELRDLLGVIRTQELLAARKIDGGQQFFTRANDFGFSKNQKETFDIWGKNEILSDVVRIIRKYQPDIIITRFPPDERAGHGHHTASAILVQEAFDQTAKSDAYPEQLKELLPWQAKRIFTNTGRWWNTTINETSPGVTTLNVGTYNALLGESYSEMAAESRTQHKSQGFGSAGRRGDAPEFFEFVKGDAPKQDIFDGINTTWSRVKGGENIQVLVNRAIQEFDLENPSRSIPLLLEIRKNVMAVEDGVWKARKLSEVNDLIQACCGLYAEAISDYYFAVPGEKITTTFELINRSGAEVNLTSISSAALSKDSSFVMSLKNNLPLSFKVNSILKKSSDFSGPYWLKESHSQGMFTVSNSNMIGMPENNAAIEFIANFKIQGEPLSLSIPVRFKWTDPVKGELYRPVEIVPPVFLNLTASVYLFNDQSPKEIEVLAKSASSNKINPVIKLELPQGWRSDPVSIPVSFQKRGEEIKVKFKVIPAREETNATMSVIAELNGIVTDRGLQLINYDHIPIQTLLPKAQAKVIRIDLKKEGALIGYIQGAGDEVPGALRNMGYEVWEMKNEEITKANLKRLDAVVLGIRALNTNDRIRYIMPDLLEYVKQGGTMVVQYNTSNELAIDPSGFSPYPITLGRDRITEENSPVRILKPGHPILNYPNKISEKDFEGWVQERGLYFPSSWDSKYETIISGNDTGEQPKDGSILVAGYGEGHYIYTGLSFFRELPEGVTGAYKLFTNMVSLKKNKKPENQKVKTKSK